MPEYLLEIDQSSFHQYYQENSEAGVFALQLPNGRVPLSWDSDQRSLLYGRRLG